MAGPLKESHSPLPWRAAGPDVFDSAGGWVASSSTSGEKVAALIAKAVNAHAGLAEDLADAIRYIGATEAAIGQRVGFGAALDILRRRLALAKP